MDKDDLRDHLGGYDGWKTVFVELPSGELIRIGGVEGTDDGENIKLLLDDKHLSEQPKLSLYKLDKRVTELHDLFEYQVREIASHLDIRGLTDGHGELKGAG